LLGLFCFVLFCCSTTRQALEELEEHTGLHGLLGTSRRLGVVSILGGSDDAGEKTVFLSHLYIKMLFLPRQARDKHKENSKKEWPFCCRDRPKLASAKPV
jgi:hypothetical protein